MSIYSQLCLCSDCSDPGSSHSRRGVVVIESSDIRLVASLVHSCRSIELRLRLRLQEIAKASSSPAIAGASNVCHHPAEAARSKHLLLWRSRRKGIDCDLRIGGGTEARRGEAKRGKVRRDERQRTGIRSDDR